jgi:arylsulfatase A-like enzyme
MFLGYPSLMSGCSSKKNESINPRLIILYATCTVNKFYLQPYNSLIGYTPALSKFAAESAVFNKHQTESGQSGTSFASIFTGSQADKHGIFEHPDSIHKSVPLITEAFSQNGYDTYFWNSHHMASYDLGYARGVKPENQNMGLITAQDKKFEGILKRLSSDKDYRVFILTNFTVTHSLYTDGFIDQLCNPATLPSQFNDMGVTVEEFYRYKKLYLSLGSQGWFFSLDFNETVRKWGFSNQELKKFIRVVEYLYKCSVQVLDKFFGSMINMLVERNLLDESLVIFTADHGETLYRDNTFFKFTHGFQLAPEVLTVPLIIRGPSLGIKPARYSFVSRSIDVFPTIAGLSGLQIPEREKIDGIDLSSVMTGNKKQPSLPAYSHTVLIHDVISKNAEYKGSLLHKFYPEKDPNLMWVSVRIGDMVLKWAKFDPEKQDFAPFAYDLSNDPSEKINLFDNQSKLHQEILAQLKKYKQNLVSAYRIKYETNEPGLPMEEQIKRLKSLGYI